MQALILRARGGLRWVGAAVVLAGLVACSSSPRRPAPVEDRGAMAGARAPGPASAPASVSAPAAGTSQSAQVAQTPQGAQGAQGAAQAPLPPGAENAGKPGYYTVKPGDTLVRIGLDHGQNWRDVARWNRLDNPNVIEVGQVLRVVPPEATVAAATARPATSGVEVRPVPSGGTSAPTAPTTPATSPGGAGPSADASAAPGSAPRPSSAARASGDGEDNLPWIWPASGAVIAAFDEQRNKGIGLAGNPGDPVLAAADGRVVYAGSGLRGYGNLVIVKHNNTFLTAYAHNQTLLVREDQTVRRGQKIAEMGSTDADRVKLHFEIRRQGKPVDPARYLPAR